MKSSDVAIDLVRHRSACDACAFLLAKEDCDDRQVIFTWEVCLVGIVGVVKEVEHDIRAHVPSLRGQKPDRMGVGLSIRRNQALLLHKPNGNGNELFAGSPRLNPMRAST